MGGSSMAESGMPAEDSGGRWGYGVFQKYGLAVPGRVWWIGTVCSCGCGGARRHHCPTCGLTGDRDLVAALLGAHTVLHDRARPGRARIDWAGAQHTLDTYGVEAINNGLQGALTESTGHRPSPHPRSGGTRRPQRSTSPTGRCRRARRTAGMNPPPATSYGGGGGPVPPTTPDEIQPATPLVRTTPERRGAHPGLSTKTGTTPALENRP
ncbi:hypothetical protein GCM10022255_013180 [Dactylosporangium darangshiense]|uniref:Transposase n=1 Tax=Dactylosporangium darangshiense TaxID=579108 RepID=A0ABP8D012_9ACTN